VHTYTVAAPTGEDPYTHVKLLNGDWYRIEAYEYRGDLFWITQEDWLIKPESTLHPANFKSPTVYYPPTASSRKAEEDSSDTNSKQEGLFPNPDTLEPSYISPGTHIAQELEQATIF
jgi:hypothetical protein